MQSHQKTNSLKHVCDVCGATYARGKFSGISHPIFLFNLFDFIPGFALKDHIKEQHGVVDEVGQVCFVQ